jgi:hypothetical protein
MTLRRYSGPTHSVLIKQKAHHGMPVAWKPTWLPSMAALCTTSPREVRCGACRERRRRGDNASGASPPSSIRRITDISLPPVEVRALTLVDFYQPLSPIDRQTISADSFAEGLPAISPKND